MFGIEDVCDIEDLLRKDNTAMSFCVSRAFLEKIHMYYTQKENIITKRMIELGLQRNVLKVIKSPNDDGVVCAIKQNDSIISWFYFSDTTDSKLSLADMSVEQFTGAYTRHDIINMLYDAICELKTEDITTYNNVKDALSDIITHTIYS